MGSNFGPSQAKKKNSKLDSCHVSMLIWKMHEEVRWVSQEAELEQFLEKGSPGHSVMESAYSTQEGTSLFQLRLIFIFLGG